jgi:hypothetical protein
MNVTTPIFIFVVISKHVLYLKFMFQGNYIYTYTKYVPLSSNFINVL